MYLPIARQNICFFTTECYFYSTYSWPAVNKYCIIYSSQKDSRIFEYQCIKLVLYDTIDPLSESCLKQINKQLKKHNKKLNPRKNYLLRIDLHLYHMHLVQVKVIALHIVWHKLCVPKKLKIFTITVRRVMHDD